MSMGLEILFTIIDTDRKYGMLLIFVGQTSKCEKTCNIQKDSHFLISHTN